MELEPRLLAITDDVRKLDSYSEIASESITMAMQAKRRLRIFSHQLNAQIYDQKGFIEAAKQLAIRHPKTEIQILIRDHTKIIKEGHRLIELAQRLSSSFEIKKIHPDFNEVLRSYLLVDNEGFIFRPYWTDPKNAFSSFNAPAQAKEYHYQFQKIWDRSEIDTTLRRL